MRGHGHRCCWVVASAEARVGSTRWGGWPGHGSRGGAPVPAAVRARGGRQGPGWGAAAALTRVSARRRPSTRTSRSCWLSARSCRSGWRTCSGRWPHAPRPRLSGAPRRHTRSRPCTRRSDAAVPAARAGRLRLVRLRPVPAASRRRFPPVTDRVLGNSVSAVVSSTPFSLLPALFQGQVGDTQASGTQGSGSRWGILVKSHPTPLEAVASPVAPSCSLLPSRVSQLTVPGKTGRYRLPQGLLVPGVLRYHFLLCTYKVFLKERNMPLFSYVLFLCLD